MNKNPYLHVLKAYLQKLEKLGEELPGVRRRVNYRGIAVETGIPKYKFKQGSELRLLVEDAVDRLGVRDVGHYDQPRRTLDTEPSPSSTNYGDLMASGDAWLRKQGYAEASVRSYKSQLNAFKRQFGRTDTCTTAQDFDIHFEGRLAAFLKATGKGKAVASMLRTWARIYCELHQSTSLPASFPAALNELLIKSGRTRTDIARDSGIKRLGDLGEWARGDRKPTDLKQVARLEEVFNVLPGTLSSKLVFSEAQRAIHVTKEWWPESWQKSSNFGYLRDRVVALIPDHLLLLPLEMLKPTFDAALSKVIDGEGEPTYRRKLRGLTKKTYLFKFKNWPDPLKSEFSAVEEYKMAPSGLSNKKRKGKWVDDTVNIDRTQLECFFGFLCLPVDHPDPELRGMGLPAESLTLAWLVVQDVVEKYLDFRRLRSGAHNTTTVSFINTWASMLRPGGGWLWLHPELLERLPESLQRKVEASGGWQDYCKSVDLELRDSLASLKRTGQIRQTRDPMLAIAPILDYPEPLSLIDAALRLTRLELEARGRPNEMVGQNLAAGWRDFVCFSFMARLPFREKHWGRFTYKVDGTGDLYKHPSDGWILMVRHSDFKNFRNKRVFTSHGRDGILRLKFSELEPLNQLIPLLELYLEKIRPVIAGEGNFLFPKMNGGGMSGRTLYDQFCRWTRKYLSQYSNKPTAIRGVFPFGPHAMRDIVATHIIKTTGSIALAANILLDSEETVRKHYARFLPEDRIGLAMAGLKRAFKTDEDEEDED